ncbi:MAG: MBL fold metallo-hydrolase [Flavobacteriaceae bacterium]|jgi:glyoxylase-like metal-dependent hydrolase (beta-lactamase superfamily II)/rhodanese-related sulfurtransferase|nr:MBL fold metallo-hydrolase [Flavobacteriaceae bacterium]
MIVEQIYTSCLSQGSYYIESNDEVAIIDPIREIDSYLEKANKRGSKIKYIFETHLHADFISGHITLAKKTGADIVYGPNTETSFNKLSAKDGQEFKIGDLTIIALHTPGHTLESTTYLLKDETGNDHAIFTGDTLFIGDVGRPDLSQNTKVDAKLFAGLLYDSLRNKIMTLDDEIIIYPGHGEGSSCGKNLSSETIGTLGNQKKTNYALRENMTKSEFIDEVLDGLDKPPKYFPFNVSMNKNGYDDSKEVLQKNLNPLDPDKFEDLISKRYVIVLDVRHQDDFAKAHIPNSIFIGLDGRFAPWVGEILEDINTPILLVVPNGREEEVITRLSRVGFDHILGYLKGGIENWTSKEKVTSSIDSSKASVLKDLENKSKHLILDVRSHDEHQNESISDSLNIPLKSINKSIDQINFKSIFYIHCQGGYRSMIAASILKKNGIHSFSNVKGGYNSIKKASLKL